MRMAICRVGVSGSITVTGSGWGRTFHDGDRVDLDASVADGHDVTWAAALGSRRDSFDDELPFRDVAPQEHEGE